jgi:hypothetical protein
VKRAWFAIAQESQLLTCRLVIVSSIGKVRASYESHLKVKVLDETVLLLFFFKPRAQEVVEGELGKLFYID